MLGGKELSLRNLPTKINNGRWKTDLISICLEHEQHFVRPLYSSWSIICVLYQKNTYVILRQYTQAKYIFIGSPSMKMMPLYLYAITVTDTKVLWCEPYTWLCVLYICGYFVLRETYFWAPTHTHTTLERFISSFMFYLRSFHFTWSGSCVCVCIVIVFVLMLCERQSIIDAVTGRPALPFVLLFNGSIYEGYKTLFVLLKESDDVVRTRPTISTPNGGCCGMRMN